MNLEENIKKGIEIIKNSDALLVTAGAGIGVDSGLPDFRGNEGFWKAYPPIAKLGISFSEMANPHWFFENPKLAWAFYGHRLNLYRKTIPHDGFSKLLEIGKSKEGGYFVFTSNVDGQFQKAGFDDEKIEECHGSIHHFQCSENCSYDIWDAKNIEVELDEDRFVAYDPLPQCENCGRIARPNILMFGDWHWLSRRTDEQSRQLNSWLTDNRRKNYKLVVIELGAGESVPTVRFKSERTASQYNGTLIRINPRDYYVPSGNISIPLNAKEGIMRLCDF
jgi:NAD-dependent SIR2 family protein deacetylase